MKLKLLLWQDVPFAKKALKSLNVKVMYVVNDTVVSKAPNSAPVVIKRLSGRNPELAQRVASRGTFKIKKRKVSQD